MKIEKSWHAVLKDEIEKPYIQELKVFLAKEKANQKVIYPPEAHVFQAFSHTPFDQVRVVIMGQDPYHGVGQAHGLSFSVPCGLALPPSLKNIFIELEQDVGIKPSTDGCLLSWAKQGVLLLNATLTVRSGEPKSHYGRGWERFTDAVVEKLLLKPEPLIFLLWGKSAQEKMQPILEKGCGHHVVLSAPHPSPFSAHTGFFGCKHFSRVNAQLKEWGQRPIDWRVG